MKQNLGKKFVLPAIGLLASLLSAQAQYFYTTNLVIVQQSQATPSGAAVAIVQMETNGIVLNTTNLPSTGPSAITLSKSQDEGYITVSANSNLLVLGGYASAPLSSGNPAISTSTNVPRGVATLDAYGNYALPINNTHIFSTKAISGAASDGTNFWVAGQGAAGGTTNNGEIGIVYVGTATQPTNVSVSETGTGVEQCLGIYDGNLYVSTGSATHGLFLISNVSGTYPEVEGSTVNNSNVIAMNSTSSPFAFDINSDGTIAYVADNGNGGIVKFTNSGAGWVSNYTLSVVTSGASALGISNALGCAVDWSKNPPVVYATTAETPNNRLVRIVDTGETAAAATMNFAPSNTVWRGLQFGPGAYPIITSQPASVIFDEGQTATFTVAAIGTPTLMYQWYSNSLANPIPMATNATLSLPNLTAGESNSVYFAIVSNPYGSAQSSNATLTVDLPGPPMYISVVPASNNVDAGSTAVFTVVFAGGTTNLTYGWTHNGTPVVDGSYGSGTNFSTNYGASTATLTISNALAIDAGTYLAFVTNSQGNGSSSPGVLTVNDPYVIDNPIGETNLPNSGSNVTLCVTADGTGLTYQWLSNGLPITGGNSSCYTILDSTTNTNVSYVAYSVIVSNSSGASVTSGSTTVAYTPLLINEDYNYPNGNLFNESAWTDVNGSNPQQVNQDRAIINQAEETTDAQLLYTQPVNDTVVWASFVVNVSQLPSNPGGVYFANFEDTNFGFYGRIFVLTTNQSGLTPGISPSAFPGTYRLGIANDQNDANGQYDYGPNAVVPIDLAPGIDYRVVCYVDLNEQVSAMAVNPATMTDLTNYFPTNVCSGIADDTFTASYSETTFEVGDYMAGYGMRQRENVGILEMDNLEVSFDWTGGFYSGAGYNAVTSGILASNPVVGLQAIGTTNYSGGTWTMEVAASGIGVTNTGGFSSLTYAWYRNNSALSDGADVTGSLTPTLMLNTLGSIDNGTYYVIVTGKAGPTQSSNTMVSVNTSIVAPSFTSVVYPGASQPVGDTVVPEGSGLTLTGTAIGTGPINYQWYFNNGAGAVPVGPYSPTASTLAFEAATNDTGTYYVVATGGTGLTATSSDATVTVTAPQVVTIAYLRDTMDASALPQGDPVETNTTSLFTITGTVTTYTNLTSGNTSSCYLQDSTGGINIFVTYASTFRPALGDVVTATGTLSLYEDNLELDVVDGVPFQTNYVNTNGDGSAVTNALPTPQPLAWGYTTAYPAATATNPCGSLVTMTNVYFEDGATNGLFTTNHEFYDITNNSGEEFEVEVSEQQTNFDGMPIPAFAYSVTGVLAEDDPPYQLFYIIVSQYADIVTNETMPPPPVTITNLAGAISGTNFILTWTAVPNTASYSVYYSPKVVTNAWPDQLTNGLTFSTAQGTYTTPYIKTNNANFYEVTSP